MTRLAKKIAFPVLATAGILCLVGCVTAVVFTVAHADLVGASVAMGFLLAGIGLAGCGTVLYVVGLGAPI